MRRRQEQHPKITPLRALALLRRLDRERHNLNGTPLSYVIDDIREALAEHVKAAMVRRRK